MAIQVFFVCTVSAQESSEKTGALLWKISGNGLAQPSYIFGTHHLFPVSFLDDIAGVKQAFASCEQMVGELVMSDMLALAGEIQKAGIMPQDTTYQLLLSEDEYRFVDEQLAAFFGVGLQALGIYKPFMIDMTYMMAFYQKTFPQTTSGDAMDSWFQQQSVSRGIPVIGLETVQDQIVALDIAPLKQQAADLVCSLKNTDYMASSTQKLHQLYHSADLAGVSAMLREDSPCPLSAEQETALNNARNERWLQKLPALMAEKPTFVAVGCLHLAGEAGLLVGLEQAGYTVEAVRE